MSLDRDQGLVNENVEEDDMPPLDNTPNPSYTFLSGMTPLSFTSTPAHPAMQDSSPPPSASFPLSPTVSPATEERTSSTVPNARPHGKKRDPSYIPRPPNAFILFRCAFIKEQNVPGKVEGNHSRLSKIIGLCWKQLPQEERDKWEAKAVQAQAEHRAQYPDWRFRPASNALSKLKVKDVGGATTSRRRGARSRAKDPRDVGDDEGPADAKGKGKERASGNVKSARAPTLEEVRCAKIASFVAEGLKGDELEIAVKEWEGKHKMAKASPKAPKSKGRGSLATSSTPHVRSRSDVAPTFRSSQRSGKRILQKKTSEDTVTTPSKSSTNVSLDTNTKLDSPEPLNSSSSKVVIDHTSNIVLSNIPLTQMYRRSLSAPTSNDPPSHSRSSPEVSDSSADEVSPTSAEPSPVSWAPPKPLVLQEPQSTMSHNHPQRDSISVSIPSKATAFESQRQLTWQEAESQRRLEEAQGPDSWWSQRSQMTDSQFVYSQSREQRNSIPSSSSNMGYNVPPGGTQFTSSYVDQYGSFVSSEGGVQRLAWGSTANNRPVTVIDDPYKDDCRVIDNSSANISSPITLSHPLSSGYYHSRTATQASPDIPSSSFSTLTGWAGEYKYQSSDVRSWSSNHTSPPLTPASTSGWYSQDSTWGTGQSELHHASLSMNSSDWDRVEESAASSLNHPVDPPRQLDFLTEIRRLHGSDTRN